MDFWALSDLATPWCVHVVVTLRIAQHLREGGGEIDKLAAAAGADPRALASVLRQLVGKGVFAEPEPGRFALNDAARELERLHGAFDLDGFGGRMAHCWNSLLSAVRSGKPAYREIFGRPFWDDLEAHPDLAAQFDDLMGPKGHGPPDPEVLIDAADWASIRTVVDVGGGTGSLLAEVLRAHPHVRGTLVDLPRTVARSHEFFREAGVADRATAVGQSFFDPLPAGADLYLLQKVLADWPDAESKAILARCAEAARPAGRVVLVTGVNPADRASPELLMLVLVGGCDRTLPEFRDLAHDAGLDVHASASVASGRFLVECRPCPGAALRDLAVRYTAAWCSQVAASVAACYSPAGSLSINGGAPAVGRAAIAELAQSFMTAFPDMRVVMDSLRLHGGRVAYHWTLIGANTGPGGSGHKVYISGFESWRIGADGLIASSAGHFDSSEYQRQLELGWED
jgi:SAM-dependent methyltransferase